MAASRAAPPPRSGSPLTPPLGSNTTIRAIKAQPPNDPIFVSGMSPNAIRFRQTCLRAIHLSRPSTSFVINRSKTWMPATSAGVTTERVICASLPAHAARLDRAGPLLDFGRNVLGEIFGAAPLRRHDRDAEAGIAFAY